MADHRLPLRASEMEDFARAVAAAHGPARCRRRRRLGAHADVDHGAWSAICSAHRGRSLVIAGEQQPPIVHALAHAMNDALGNVGQTVVYTDPVEANPVDQLQSLRELVADMDAGSVEMLVILGGNPVYTAPADLHFAEQPAEGRPARAPEPVRRRDLASSVTGTSPRRTTSSRGATRAPTTARSPSCSR